jgi:hypothetical protein
MQRVGLLLPGATDALAASTERGLAALKEGLLCRLALTCSGFDVGEGENIDSSVLTWEEWTLWWWAQDRRRSI